MISGQTKISVDTSKEVQNDATLKTKVIRKKIILDVRNGDPYKLIHKGNVHKLS